MKRKHSLYSVLLILALTITSCEFPSGSIVVAGDSWSAFLCYYNSFERAFALHKIRNLYVQKSCTSTTRFGVRAENWQNSTYHQNLLNYLVNPEVKVLYLSLGGNDLIHYWNRSLTQMQEQELLTQIRKNIQKTLNVYLYLRPDLRIIVSGYDYPRFTPQHIVPAYRNAYEKMGSPTPFEINSLLIRFSNEVSKVADQKKVFYIQHYGLMQYYFNSSKLLSPSEISPPENSNRFGGDLYMQSPSESLLKLGIANFAIVDAFHLSPFGYNKIAEHTVEHYLKRLHLAQ